jgi:hypothetical protein
LLAAKLEGVSLHETNPAGRLFLFCSATNEHSDEISLRQAWNTYFETEDPVVYLQRIADTVDLTRQVREAVELLDDPVIPKHKLVEALEPFEQRVLVDIDGGQNLYWWRAGVTSGHITSFENCSYLLHRAKPTPQMTEDSISKIRAMAEDIASTVTAAEDIERDVREKVLEFAHRLIRACDSYKINGVDAFNDELDRFLGVINSTDLKKRTPKNLWEKVNTTAVAVLLALNLWSAPAQAIESGATYFKVFEMPSTIQAPPEINSEPGQGDPT